VILSLTICGFAGQYYRAVVPAKLLHLGIEVGIKPVSAADGGAQIVDDHGGRDAAKVPERILQTAQETLAGLSPDHFAVTLA